MLKEKLEEYENLMIADGYDDAIIGVVSSTTPVVAYSIQKIIKILMKKGMDEEEAQEFFEFNIQGAYMGEQTPIYIDEVEYDS